VIADLLRAPRVAPSILSADLSRLGAELETVIAAGARVIHVDVMDGHFVPPISFGAVVLEAIREQVSAGGGALDVHLMIERPERQLAAFAAAGADLITVHHEALTEVRSVLEQVRETGCRCGLSIKPGTPAEVVADLGDDLDLVLCMSVEPGWSGQSFIPATLAKLERLRELLPADVVVEVDGGLNAETIPPCARAGATLFVAASAVFGAADPGAAFAELTALAAAA
jgi:ribulose-phosphate 3-epimerase